MNYPIFYFDLRMTLMSDNSRMKMKLYNIHCGFYDHELSDGIFEFHINIPIVAETIENAKMKIRENAMFSKKKMHIDGIQEIHFVDGFEIALTKTKEGTSNGIIDIPFRDL